MAQKKALVAATGTLLSHGFVEFTPELGETVLQVAEDFALQPGWWKWDAAAEKWVAVTPFPTARELAVAEIAKLDPDKITDLASAKAVIKTLVGALKQVI